MPEIKAEISPVEKLTLKIPEGEKRFLGGKEIVGIFKQRLFNRETGEYDEPLTRYDLEGNQSVCLNDKGEAKTWQTEKRIVRGEAE